MNIILIIVLVVLTISGMFTTVYIREHQQKGSSFNENSNTDYKQIVYEDEKQYNPKAKVLFDQREKNILNNAIGALGWMSVSEGEQKMMEYIDQTFFFDNTRVEDCVALKLLIEKYLQIKNWEVAIRILNEKIK